MTVKTITITEEAYKAIKWLKKEHESFSELFLRIGKKPLTIKDITGILRRTPEESQKSVKEFWEQRRTIGDAMKKRRENVHSGLKHTN